MSKINELLEGRLKNKHVTWVVGSTQYGLNTESSDTDLTHLYWDADDYLRVFSELPEVHHEEGNNAPVEQKIYSLPKFADMLTKGNPNTVELCFYEPRIDTLATYTQATIYNFLVSLRPYVLTQKSLRQYLGHVQSVIHELDRFSREPEEYNEPSVKRISHALRIGVTVREIMATEDMFKLIESTDGSREYILDCKMGKVPKDKMHQDMRELYSHVSELFDSVKGSFPEDATLLRETINEMMIELVGASSWGK